MGTILKVVFTTLCGFLIGNVFISMAWSADTSDQIPFETVNQAPADHVLQFLRSDQFVPSRLALRDLSDDIVQDLLPIVLSNKQPTFVRGRALESLGLYDQDPRVLSIADELFTTIADSHELYPAIVHFYAKAHRERAVERLSALLQHDEDHIREIAVISLGRFGGQSGFELLRKHKSQEESDHVLQRIKSYVP